LLPAPILNAQNRYMVMGDEDSFYPCNQFTDHSYHPESVGLRITIEVFSDLWDYEAKTCNRVQSVWAREVIF